MTECARCGDCCESFPLNTPERADIWGRAMLTEVGRIGAKHTGRGVSRKQAAWMGNLTVVAGPYRHEDGTMRWRYSCPLFDPVARVCTDHANRPPICSRYPWYDREPDTYKSLPPRCSFIADTPDVKMLPIVEVRHGSGSGAVAALAGGPGLPELA